MQSIKAIKLDKSNSVLLEVTEPNKETFQLWFDLFTTDGSELNHLTPVEDITGDWNKYIFHLFNPDDMRDKNFQEKPNNYIECLEIATDYFNIFPF